MEIWKDFQTQSDDPVINRREEMDDIKETRRETFLNVWPSNNIFSFNIENIFVSVRCYMNKSIAANLLEFTSRYSYDLNSDLMLFLFALLSVYKILQKQKLVIWRKIEFLYQFWLSYFENNLTETCKLKSKKKVKKT